MKKFILFFLCLFVCFSFSFGQGVPNNAGHGTLQNHIPVKNGNFHLPENLVPNNQMNPGVLQAQTNLNQNVQGNHPQNGMQLLTMTCGVDTVLYPELKATGYLGTGGLFPGIQVGQWYDAPQAMTIYGFRCYIYLDSNTNATQQITAQIFLADPVDSLPTGAALGTQLITIDSNFYNIGLMRRDIVFPAPVVINAANLPGVAYVLVINNTTTMDIGVLSNDYTALPPDGLQEWLDFLYVPGLPSGQWYRGDNTPAGPIDADFIFEPFTEFELDADFTPDPSVGCPGLALNFTNTSSPILQDRFYNLAAFAGVQNTSCYAWDYGDGNSSLTFNGADTYALVGSYTVTLIDTMFGYYWNCIDPEMGNVTIGGPPASAFNYILSGANATFTDASTGPPATWFWDFGDGTTSNVQNPTHTYPAAGTYNACLTVTNPCGDSTTCQSVLVGCIPPFAVFSWSTNLLTANFTDQSNGGVTSWQWNFGDGFTSNAPSPSHTYAVSGNYLVCLVVSNNCGADTLCIQVNMYCPLPNTFFNFTTLGNTTTFQNQSTGANTFLWSFGDGQSSNLQNPVHTYPAVGNYQACLVTSNACGQDTFCRPIVITCIPPVAGFTESTSQDSVVQFTETSSGNSNNFIWHFGDGGTSIDPNPVHIYSAPGNYHVCLYVNNNCGQDSICHTVNITCLWPTSSFNAILQNGEATFNDASFHAQTWYWDFDDGTTSTLQNPNHTYHQSGTYHVCLYTTNFCGSNMFCQNVVVVCNLPNPSFTYAMGNQFVNFIGASDNMTTDWLWDFGDGGSSTLQNPQHYFLYYGMYYVCLRTDNSCGAREHCENVLVTTIGMDDAWEQTLTVYPNPNTGKFTVDASFPVGEEITGIVTDLSGRELMLPFSETSTGMYHNEIDLGNVASGVYLLKLKVGERETFRKIIVE